MAETEIETSRVFVKGLPQSFTSDQLASHFSTQFKVTDAHVVADRRIGFVGLTDHDSALNAVKYFNRSYVRMSKIFVDLARAVEVKHDNLGHATPISQRNFRQPPQTQRPTQTKRHDPNNKGPTKRKREIRDDGELERTGGQPELAPKDSKENDQVKDTPDTTAGDGHGESQEISVPASDNDWLRGKTSRVLDLVTADEVRTSGTVGLEEPQKEQLEEVQEQSSNSELGQDAEAEEHVQCVPNGRLFLRNLAFDVTDADLEDRFSHFGKLQEAHVVKDARTRSSKGLAFIQFSEPEAAEIALKSLDGASFHGRLLHILPASDKRDQGLTDFDLSKMSLKKQKAIKRKMNASTAVFSWNSLYLNPDAVISSMADRLGVSKADILDPTSSDAAVKQAHAETQLIAETKAYLRSQGVNIDAFENRQRDDKIILLKNFAFGTSEDELRALLEPFGQISKFILPPAGIMALVQFVDHYAATQALKQLAYKNVKGSVLYLEKAPEGLLSAAMTSVSKSSSVEDTTRDDQSHQDHDMSGEGVTLFVRNLDFNTTSARLTETFNLLPGFRSARVKTRIDPKRPGEILSMGFGFVEFLNKVTADAAMAALHGYRLDGHHLVVQISNRVTDLAEERRREDDAMKRDSDRTKIIIKNLPFQASKKDVRSLFSPYGQLKTVRVPKKFDNSSRGFGFAEFVTAKEARNAVDALSNTHLLGRRLVLEFTDQDDIDPEEQIAAMEKKMEQQNNRMQFSKISGNGRRKFVMGADEDLVE